VIKFVNFRTVEGSTAFVGPLRQSRDIFLMNSFPLLSNSSFDDGLCIFYWSLIRGTGEPLHQGVFLEAKWIHEWTRWSSL